MGKGYGGRVGSVRPESGKRLNRFKGFPDRWSGSGRNGDEKTGRTQLLGDILFDGNP